MSSLNTDLAAALSTVRRTAEFCVSGAADLALPALEVEGVGPVALPLLPIQAEQLVAAAERAPFGRGEKTVLDMTVRRTWQFDAGRVRLGGRSWARTLDSVVARAAEGLGVEGPVRADLHKLLLYAPGDFFVSHRDTEKASGMFGTLVVVLPSAPRSEGGLLVVRHKNDERRCDLGPDDPSELRFAAFYADCRHTVTPVTAGHRLALIFNLIRPGSAVALEAPDYETETSRVSALLQGWAAAGRDAPDKLVVPLEHAYTPAELGFATLKGADAALAKVLATAAAAAACALRLALVEIEESGYAEYVDHGGRGRWSEPDLEVGEVTDESRRLTRWQRPDGPDPALPDLPFETDELVPPDIFDDLEPDEEEFHEATGNEGASFERSYRRAALVLWPNRRHLAVLGHGGQAVTLPLLEGLAAADDDARELTALIIEDWPEQPWLGEGERPGNASRVLAALTRLREVQGIAAFLDRLAVAGGFGPGDAAGMAAAMGLLKPEAAAALVERVSATWAARAPGTCARLLARAAEALPADRGALLVGAGEALLKALSEPAGDGLGWGGRRREPTPAAVVEIATALIAVDQGLAGRAVDHLLASSTSHDPDAVLVPTALAAIGLGTGVAVERLRAAALAHLAARIALPLEPPADWRRDTALGCTCATCRELAGFLDDPTRNMWSLRASEERRSHVEEMVRRSGSDLDLRTERKGRPYTLVCVKNQASHHRRLAERRRDLENARLLEPKSP